MAVHEYKFAFLRGWLRDKFGVSWQIVPYDLNRWMEDKKKSERVMQALITMKKPDLKKLRKAWEGVKITKY